MNSQLDRLDSIACEAAKGNFTNVGVLSTGERLYVALAANSPELLVKYDYTVAEALARIGPEWIAALIERWQYRGNPKKFSENPTDQP